MVSATAQTLTDIKVPVRADPLITINFNDPIRAWDGFGVNYVETSQTRDYGKWKQEYGGFSILNKKQRDEILDLVFGADGLRPALLKMFLDPFHEGITASGNDNADPYKLDQSRFDHETTTKWMRLFAREGSRRVKAWSGDLSVLTTLYGRAPWMTRQRFLLGRDIEPAAEPELAE